jgi:CheY-like chemotaxis protein/HPt (histidine-containing phosphotransfer) domain-containing protein
LTPQGHKIDVVENGRQAVEAVERQRYDLVLMDMHMPEMGGIEATQAIRKLRGAAASVPIIAITASVTSEGIERGLAAGMNDHVSKPIHPSALNAAILRVLAADAAAAPEEAEVDITKQLLDGERALDEAVLGGLESQLGREVVGELVGDFILASEDHRRTMAAAEAAGEAESWGEAAHSLKGAAGSLGLGRLFGSALAIEQACLAKDLAAASAAQRDIPERIAEAHRLLRQRYPAAISAETRAP